MPSHLKGLLKKEWYLLWHDYTRIFAEFVLPIILGLLLTGVDKMELKKKNDGGSLLYYGYTSGSSGGGSFNYSEFEFRNCRLQNDTSKVRKWIGLVTQGDEDGTRFKDLLNATINSKRPEEKKIPLKVFSSESDMLTFARSSNRDPQQTDLTHALCFGITFNKRENDYNYKLFLDERLFSFKENIYDELSL